MTNADDFLAAIRAAGPKGDPSLWLRYADWLEDDERQPGDRLLAESIRLAMELESDFGHAPKLWRATIPERGRWTIDETVMIHEFESYNDGSVIKTCGPVTVAMDLNLYWQLHGDEPPPIHADLRFPIAGRHDDGVYRVCGDFHPLYRGTHQDYEDETYRFVIARSAIHDSLMRRIALLDRQDIVRDEYLNAVGFSDQDGEWRRGLFVLNGRMKQPRLVAYE